MTFDAVAALRPGRTITGMSAILLPHLDPHTVDWPAFEAHVDRTHAAGLTPAVNMDTGYVQLLDPATKQQVLDIAAQVTGGEFVAGAFVSDEEGASFDLAGYLTAIKQISAAGGTAMIFPSHGLNGGTDRDWIAALQAIAAEVDRFYGFELGPMFVPYGRIVSLETYGELLSIPQCIGAKHSSLSRELEWQRLRLRDEHRPGFQVLTGNDLAIDMVMYGSDYLLGLSTFAPEAFAERDRRWAAGDPGFYELNDVLQYLGYFTFRDPVPGYRHDAAMMLALRGWATADAIPADAPRRPEADRAVLQGILELLAAQGVAT